MIRVVVLASAAVTLWPWSAAPWPSFGGVGGGRTGLSLPPWSGRTAAAAGSGAIPSSGRIAASTVAVVAALVVSPLAGVAVAVATVALLARSRRSATAGRRRELVVALPDALDLCTVVLGAGGTLRDAVTALADQGPLPVRGAATAACRRLGAGATLDDALRGLRGDLGPVFQPLTGALLLANEQGGSIGLLLTRLATEASGSRRRLGELRARRLPVALLGPLIVCSLPAVLIGAVVPLALVSLADLDL